MAEEEKNDTPTGEPGPAEEEQLAEAEAGREPTAEAEAEEPTAEAPVEEPVAEPPAEDAATDEPAAEATAEEPTAEDAATEEPVAEAGAEEPAPEAGEPAAQDDSAEAPPARKKKKRLPRAERPRRTKPKRERPKERKPITRLPKPEHARGRRQERQGTVVSSSADKTIVVRVDVVKVHPMYKKVIRRSSRLHAHDEGNQAKVGDIVRIVETRPISRLKRWRLQEIVEAAK
jgi:small subunit ribosomal protein S17